MKTWLRLADKQRTTGDLAAASIRGISAVKSLVTVVFLRAVRLVTVERNETVKSASEKTDRVDGRRDDAEWSQRKKNNCVMAQHISF